MITITTPDRFIRTPWKNGRGFTTQLAIDDGGSIVDFGWRISMARVDEDGPFSSFLDYERSLVLLRGHGIELRHDDGTVDRLVAPLDIARFDGGRSTHGCLVDGGITDFNVITRVSRFRSHVDTFVEADGVPVPRAAIVFVYPLEQPCRVYGTADGPVTTVSAGHLLRITDERNAERWVAGHNVIVVAIDSL